MNSYADHCPPGKIEDPNDPEKCIDNPPPPGDFPIDKNLLLLGLVAVSFGTYTIYKTHKSIKKNG